jgi:glycosyltransferase involved in cell wall biosynthesis
MRLLISSPSPDRGGVEEYALTIGASAVQEGWEVHAAFPQAQETASLAQDFSEKGVQYHPQKIYLTNVGSLKRTGQNFLRLAQAIDLLVKVKPDVVLINLPLPVQCLDIIFACALFKIPTAIIFHSIPVRLSFNRHKLRLYHWAQARNQQWIGVSGYNCKLVSKSFQLPDGQVRCIYNGVKLMPSSIHSQTEGISRSRDQVRQELGLPKTSQLILTVGRLDLEKGYGDLVSVIPQIVKEFPEARFVWVGEGQHRAYLTNQVREYGIEDQVLFLGYRTDVPRLLQSADLFVFPTHYEGMPFALLEAMAHSVPIVTSDASGIPEIIKHRLHGLLFSNSDCADLGKTLSWALSHPDQMQALALNAKLRVQDFSEERMVKDTLCLFRQ